MPASALIFGDNGTAVAVGRAERPRGREAASRSCATTATSVEIAGGITANDRVIDNPPDSLRAGDTVKVASASSGA